MLRTVGPGDVQRPLEVEADHPATFVHGVVVADAQRDQVRQIGRPAGFPRLDVVDVAPLEPHVTVAPLAGAVHLSQRPTLCPVGESLLAADVQDLAGAAVDDRDDRRFAKKAARRSRWDRRAVGQLTDAGLAQPGPQHLVVDVGAELGEPGRRSA